MDETLLYQNWEVNRDRRSFIIWEGEDLFYLRLISLILALSRTEREGHTVAPDISGLKPWARGKSPLALENGFASR